MQKLEAWCISRTLCILKISLASVDKQILVEVVNGKVNITDYKTNKEIKDKGFTNWEGITSKMFKPVNNLRGL
jgi:hypothetical protein